NRRKTGMHTRLSCKIDYLLRSNHRDRSIASKFFTDDSKGSLCSREGGHEALSTASTLVGTISTLSRVKTWKKFDRLRAKGASLSEGFAQTSLLGDVIHHAGAQPSAVCQHPGYGAWRTPSFNTLIFGLHPVWMTRS